VLAQFDGTLTAEEAKERTVGTTRRFVRRQRSWFRRDPQLTWFDAGRPGLLDAVTSAIADRTIEP
jgi:tRNA dimethylallyltransferase